MSPPRQPRERRRRVSPALILAIVAVVLSLAGTTYAGVQIGRSSIGTFQLRNGSVTTAKLHDGAVTAAKAQGCPSNTIAIGPGCVENGLRPPKGYSEAVAICAAAEGRLPSVSELAAIASLGHPLGNPELTGELGGRERQVVIFSDARTVGEDTIGTPRRFRCVLSPV